MSTIEDLEKEIEDKIKSTPNKTRYIPYFIIAIMFVILIFGNSLYRKEKLEKERLINEINVSKVIEDIEQPGLEEVRKRETEAAAIRKQQAEIDKKLEQIYANKKNSKSNLEAKKNEIKKANIFAINRMFTQRGYSTAVIR